VGQSARSIPFSQLQSVGYSFTVAIDVSYVNDPIPSMLATATFADYKLVIVTSPRPRAPAGDDVDAGRAAK
jgi:hypothetical protein